MKRLLLASALLWSGVASAADMPLKNLPVTPGYPSKCGVFFGLNSEGVSGPVNGAAPGTITLGGMIGGDIGYACQFMGIPWYTQVLGDFQNLNASSPGFSLSGPAHIEWRTGVQFPFLQFASFFNFAQLGNIPNVVLPPGATPNGTPVTYVYGSLNADDISTTVGVATARAWLFSPEVGIEEDTPVKLSNNWNAVIAAGAGAELESGSISVGGMNPKFSTRFKAWLDFRI